MGDWIDSAAAHGLVEVTHDDRECTLVDKEVFLIFPITLRIAEQSSDALTYGCQATDKACVCAFLIHN